MNWVALVLLGITGVSFLYPGYQVFDGDQRLFLPWINRSFNPHLYPNDPVANIDHLKFSLYDEIADFAVNTLGIDFFVWLLVATIFSRLLFFYALYRLSLYFTNNLTFSLLLPLLFMTNLTVFGTSMDTLIYEAHHRTSSLAFSLLFLALYLEDRPAHSLLALLAALTMNPLTTPAFILFFIIDSLLRRRSRPTYV